MHKSFSVLILTSYFLLLTSVAFAQQRPFPPGEDPGSQEKAIRVKPLLDIPPRPRAPETGIERDLLLEEKMNIVLFRRLITEESGATQVSYFIHTATKDQMRLARLGKFLKSDLAYAQQIPPSATPGAEEKALQEEREEREPEEKPKAPSVTIKDEKGELVPEGVPFFVKDIRVVGNQAISTKQIRKITDAYENKEINLQELKNVAKLITRLYQSKGYLTSRAFIPPQEIVEGIVTIEVLEARLGEVRVEGNKRIPAKWIQDAVRLRKGDVFQVKRLERDLIRMNKNPDVEVRAVLVRGKEPGTTDVILTVSEKFPVHAGYTFDNLGTKFSGRIRHNIDVTANGIRHLNDRLSGRVILTDSAEFVGVVADYVTPINQKGTSAEMTFSNVNIHLGRGLKPLEVLGRATVFSPTIIQTLYESDKLEANIAGGFDFKTIKTRVLGRELSDDELRELRIGPNITEWDKWGRSVLSTNFLFAFPSFFGASDKKDKNASRPQTGGQFQIYQITAARVQNLWKSLVAFLRFSTQFTPDRLVTAEQFRIGGMNTVRGYPEGEFLGDYGFNGTAELRIPPFFLPKEIKFFKTKVSMKESVQFMLFCDIAKGYLNKPLPQEDSSKLLIGVGPGVLLDVFRHVTARVMLGIPVGERSNEENNPRLHFVLTATW